MRLRRGERLISRGYRQHALKGDFRGPLVSDGEGELARHFPFEPGAARPVRADAIPWLRATLRL